MIARSFIQPPPPPKVTPGYCSTGRPRCGKKARLYAAGWRCDNHKPRSTQP